MGVVPAISEFDVTQYTGRWYQISADRFVMATFERNAICVTADYTLDGSSIRLVNAQRTGDPSSGEPSNVTGVAYASDASKPAELNVEFDFGAKGTYWIVKIGPVENGQYQYSVVFDEKSRTLFVLARNLETYEKKYAEEVDAFLIEANFQGFLKGPIPTLQEGCSYPPVISEKENYCPSSPAALHASCDETVTFKESCDIVKEEMTLRVQNENGWFDAHNNGTYKVLETSNDHFSLERETGDKKYVDNLNFYFQDNKNGCLVSACSASQVTSILDFGTNHCNLFILYCGSSDSCPYVKYDLTYTETINSCTDASSACVTSPMAIEKLHDTDMTTHLHQIAARQTITKATE